MVRPSKLSAQKDFTESVQFLISLFESDHTDKVTLKVTLVNLAPQCTTEAVSQNGGPQFSADEKVFANISPVGWDAINEILSRVKYDIVAQLQYAVKQFGPCFDRHAKILKYAEGLPRVKLVMTDNAWEELHASVEQPKSLLVLIELFHILRIANMETCPWRRILIIALKLDQDIDALEKCVDKVKDTPEAKAIVKLLGLNGTHEVYIVVSKLGMDLMTHCPRLEKRLVLTAGSVHAPFARQGCVRNGEQPLDATFDVNAVVMGTELWAKINQMVGQASMNYYETQKEELTRRLKLVWTKWPAKNTDGKLFRFFPAFKPWDNTDNTVAPASAADNNVEDTNGDAQLPAIPEEQVATDQQATHTNGDAQLPAIPEEQVATDQQATHTNDTNQSDESSQSSSAEESAQSSSSSSESCSSSCSTPSSSESDNTPTGGQSTAAEMVLDKGLAQHMQKVRGNQKARGGARRKQTSRETNRRLRSRSST